MKYKSFLLSCAVFFGMGATPAAAATVTHFDSQTALITIDMQFDAFADFAVPAFSDHIIHNTDRNEIGFEITDSTGERPSIERVSSVVLSNQPLSGTRYQIDRGSTGKFTLAALVRLNEPVDSLDAQITHLPYWIDGRRTTLPID